MSMNRLPILLKLIFVISIASVLFSCTPKAVNLETLDPNTYDQSWLTGKPCAAPCWYGLEPGISTRQDSDSTVERLTFINDNSNTITDKFGSTFFCKQPQSFNCVNMDFENDVLEDIYFVPNYQITFEQAVKKLGKPDGFLVQPLYPDAGGCKLQVVWKNKRLVINYDTGIISIFSSGQSLNDKLCNGEGNLPLPKGILVQRVAILSPRDFASLIQDYSPQTWKGFENK
jgi:hypothetical protein